MTRLCTLELGGLLLVALSTAAAKSSEFDELFDELDSPVLIREVAEMTGADPARLREAARDLRQVLPAAVESALSAEDWQFLFEPAPLELPVKPPVSEQQIWPQPQRRDWPVGAESYVPQLKWVFLDEGVPAELVWLAEVESGFEPWARSRAGAAGLFQLMPETAELLGLSLKPADERFLPVKSARAAARYLKYLHGKFRDWRLTLAAYNAGEGRVRRLLEQYRAREFNQIASRLPPETRLYVPKVEAVILRREGIALGDLPAPGRW